jgi:UDP-N-acetylmuramyl tripeptide synthase
LVAEGVKAQMGQEGARAQEYVEVLDEVEAMRWALERAKPGDVVALCVDSTSDIYAELENTAKTAMPGSV